MEYENCSGNDGVFSNGDGIDICICLWWIWYVVVKCCVFDQ